MKSAIFLSLALACGGAAAQGAIGGNLHRATLREWHLASSANQVATVADIIEKLLNIGDPVVVTRRAREVQACINRVSDNFQLRSQLVADTAVACIAELGYLPR